MKKTKVRLGIATFLTLCWLCVIWGNSLLPGEESSQVSGWVGRLLESILPFLSMESDTAMLILRKLGHFSEFAVLGCLLLWLLGMLGKRCWLPLILGVAAAGVDETIQLFVPQRHGCVSDVLIDSAGVVFGIGLLLLLRNWKNKK